jgi:hypothetical protein
MLAWQQGEAVGIPRAAEVLIPAVNHSKPDGIVFRDTQSDQNLRIYGILLILMLMLILVMMSVMMVVI